MYRFSRILLIIPLFLFIIGISILIFFFTGKKTSPINQPNTQQTNSKTMEELLGNNWSYYIKKDSEPSTQMFYITVVSDGIVHKDTLPIKTKEGEVLASTLLYFQGSYYDNNGVKQKLIIPTLIKLTNNKIFHPSSDNNINWSDDQIAANIKDKPNLFGSAKGIVIQVGIIKDQILSSNISSSTSMHQEILPIINKYNLSWKKELDQLIADGNPSINILFPYSFVKPRDQQYVVIK